MVKKAGAALPRTLKNLLGSETKEFGGRCAQKDRRSGGGGGSGILRPQGGEAYERGGGEIYSNGGSRCEKELTCEKKVR